MVHMQQQLYEQFRICTVCRKATKKRHNIHTDTFNERRKKSEKKSVIIMKYSKTREKMKRKRERIKYAIRCELYEENAHWKKKHRFGEASVGSERVRDMDCDLCAQRTEIVSICRNCTMSMVNEGNERGDGDSDTTTAAAVSAESEERTAKLPKQKQ